MKLTLINLRKSNFLSYAIFLSLLEVYSPKNIALIISMSVILLLLIDLLVRVSALHANISSLVSTRSKLIFYTFCTLIVTTLIVLSYRSSKPFQKGIFYPDSLFNSALLQQFSSGSSGQPIFGLNSRIDYYTGAFSTLGPLTKIFDFDSYSALITIVIPFLILSLSITFINLVFKLSAKLSAKHVFFIAFFSAFCNGNFFIQPNIDSRLFALFPLVSLTQSLGLILFFDLVMKISDSQNQYKTLTFFKSSALLLICLLVVKPPLCVIAIIFIVSQIDFFKHQLRTLFFFSIAWCASLLYTQSGSDFFLFNPHLPGVFSDTSLTMVCLISYYFYRKRFGQLDGLDNLVLPFIYIEISFLFFSFYGSEVWFRDPLRLLIQIRLFTVLFQLRSSDTGNQSRIMPKLFLLVVSFFLIDSFQERLFSSNIFFKLSYAFIFLLFLFLFFHEYLLGQKFLCSNIKNRNVLISRHHFRAVRQNLLVVCCYSILFSSFNPLLVINSLGQIKVSDSAVGISLSSSDFDELRQMSLFVQSETHRDDVIGLSNLLCANGLDLPVGKNDIACDSRIFLMSGIIGLRSPFEGWLFPVWSSENSIQRKFLIVKSYSDSLNSWSSFKDWLSNYQDPIIRRINVVYFLYDVDGNFNPFKENTELIYRGHRFHLYRYNLSNSS